MRQVVRCFLENDEWRYLLVKHPKSENWALPGWHIEENETIFDAIHREIKEEFNLDIEIIWEKNWFKSDNILEFPAPISIYNIWYNSNKHWFVEKQEYIFKAKIIWWELKIQEEEIEEYDFYKNEILELKNTFEQIKKLAQKL